MCFGVGHRRSPDPVLLWLWCRLAAVAPIQSLAWEPPYGPKKKKKKKRKESKQAKIKIRYFSLQVVMCLSEIRFGSSKY